MTNVYGHCTQFYISKTKPYAQHTINPAGSKLLRRAMKNATGKKHPSFKESRDWHRKLPGHYVSVRGHN
jgi:hypothetical protein